MMMMDIAANDDDDNNDANLCVNIEKLNPLLTCLLCGGYLNDAYTIVECLHSFCHSCLLEHFGNESVSSKHCPICDIDLGAKPMKTLVRADHTLQSIVDKLEAAASPNVRSSLTSQDANMVDINAFKILVCPRINGGRTFSIQASGAHKLRHIQIHLSQCLQVDRDCLSFGPRKCKVNDLDATMESIFAQNKLTNQDTLNLVYKIDE